MNRTRYTCPFLMHIAHYFYKIKLWRTHVVYWKVPTDGSYGAYVVAQPRGKQGGFQVSCPFPRWAIFTEMRIRRFCLGCYAWVRFPKKMWQHEVWKHNTRKKQKAWTRSQRLKQSL